MKDEYKNEQIEEALIKRATGYDVAEITEEHVADENGNLSLSKKRITKKHITPDISALKLYLEMQEGEKIEEMTEEELLEKRKELLNELKNKKE